MALKAHLEHFPDDFQISEVRFTDAMGDLYEAHIRGESTNPSVDLAAFLGESVTLELQDEPLLPTISGIVQRVARGTPEPEGMTTYEVVVVPREWWLTKRTNCRIFQDKALFEIIEEITKEHQRIARPKWSADPMSQREYVVQYDETDYDFLRRRMAEEGICSYFDHHAAAAWTFVRRTTDMRPVEDWPTVEVNSSNAKPGALAVLQLREEKGLTFARAVMRSYDEDNPYYPLEATEAVPASRASAAEASLEDFAYEPGLFLTDEEGNALAKRDMIVARSRARHTKMETNFGASSGTLLRILDAPLMGDWLVVRSELSLRALPSGATDRRSQLDVQLHHVPFLLAHIKKPRIFGTQVARVVGGSAPGTVDVDEQGRVYVEFRWDRRDARKGALTRRVRVAQAWAGPGYGFVTLPRIGDEVLVTYQEGDPDEPIVSGRVHNPVSTTPLHLPDEATKTVWRSQSVGPGGPVDGYNSILMDDAAAAELLALRAQRDSRWDTLRRSEVTVGENQLVHVNGSQSVVVGGGQAIQAGGQSVSSGHQSTRLAGNYSLECKQADIVASAMRITTMEGNLELTAAGERVDRSGTKHHFESPSIFMKTYDVVQVVTPHFHVFAGDEIVLQVGGSSIRITSGGIDIASGGEVKINGATVKLNC